MFYRRALAFCAMLAMGLIYRGETLVDWDSWDYASEAMCWHSSNLGLGRWWFIMTMRGAYEVGHLVTGLEPLQCYVAMQMACAVMMAGAVVMAMAWVHRLTRSAAAESILALMLVTGPLVGIYGANVMTEGMTVLMIASACWAWQRAVDAQAGRPWLWALAAGLCFGVAVDIREPVVMLCVLPVISCFTDRPRRRWRLLGLAALGALVTLGAGVAGAEAAYAVERNGRTYLQNLNTYRLAMIEERRQYALDFVGNLGWLAKYAVVVSPAAGLLAIPAVAWAWLKDRRILWVLLAAVPYTMGLLANHDLPICGRFCIPLMWIVAPCVAIVIDKAVVGGGPRRQWRLAGVAAFLLGGMTVFTFMELDAMKTYYFLYAERQSRAYYALKTLPRDAVIVPGPGTPSASFLCRLGAKDFDIVYSGWYWPGDKIEEKLGQAVARGRDVYCDMDPGDWICATRENPEWPQLRQTALKYEWDWSKESWPMVRLVQPVAQPPTSQPATAPATTSVGR